LSGLYIGLIIAVREKEKDNNIINILVKIKIPP
jgi:hypothetical protein